VARYAYKLFIGVGWSIDKPVEVKSLSPTQSDSFTHSRWLIAALQNADNLCQMVDQLIQFVNDPLIHSGQAGICPRNLAPLWKARLLWDISGAIKRPQAVLIVRTRPVTHARGLRTTETTQGAGQHVTCDLNRWKWGSSSGWQGVTTIAC